MGRKKVWPPRPHVHAASGQERVKVDGVHHYLGPAGSPEARRRYGELLARLANDENARPQQRQKAAAPSPAGSPSLTVAELVARWHAYAKERYSEEGRESQQYRHALAPLVEECGGLPVPDFGMAQLRKVRDAMIRKGWNRGVIGRRVCRVRTVWRWAVAEGLAPPGSWSALKELAPLPANDARVSKAKPRKAFDWPALARVCRACRSRRVRAMMLAMWFTGARPSEIRLMRVGEIDRSGPEWSYRPAGHKNAWRGQEREILIGPKAQAVLRPFLEGKGPKALVFEADPEGRPGKPYSDVSFARAVARAAERCGLEGFCAYSLRHSYKQRVTREMGMDAARAGMGQLSPESTAGYAKEVDRKTASEVARRFG